MTHSDTRRRRKRRSRRRCCNGGLFVARQLIGDGRRVCRTSNLEVIATATQVEKTGVVGVFQNANEHPLAEAFRIATQQLAGARLNDARPYRLVARREIGNRSTNEIKCFGARQTLAE
jgi:hypothetical protein